MAASQRVVLITGGAGAIGSAMIEALLAAGHSVAAVDRDRVALDRLMTRHAGARNRLLGVPGELSDPAFCTEAVEIAVTHFGRLEGVINNAGIGMSSIRPDAEINHPGIEELTGELWDSFFAINVRAPLLVTQAALPHMKHAGFGRIVNVTTSFVTMLRVMPYGATKSALEAMSAVWAEELAPAGITVNVLIPGGPTDTPFISEQTGWPRDQMLRPQIMGPPAAWLVSDEAADFTGQRIIAGRWNTGLAPAEAAKRTSRAIGWPELAADVIWLQNNQS